MPTFSQRSLDRLHTCHPDLQVLFKQVVRTFDCSILEGHRNETDQNAAYAAGKSQLKYPHGKHNALPSMAVDVAPYPIDWNDLARFRYFAGFVMGAAKMLLAQGEMEYAVRWGGNWDQDTQLKDNRFNDLVHFELTEVTP